MEATGLRADSSLAPGSRILRRLPIELGASNMARRVGQVWEIPVTYYDQVRIGRWQSKRHLSIDGSSLAEIKHVVRSAVRQRLPTVCILIHSFSFTRQGRPDVRFIRRLSALLEWLQKQDEVEVDTVQGILQRLDSDVLPEQTVQVPHTGIWLTWCRALGSWRDGWKNLVVATAGVGVLAIGTAIIAYAGYSIFGP